jgi:hypothetical protein
MKKRAYNEAMKARRRLWLWVSLLLAVVVYSASCAHAETLERAFKVTFVSPELVYLNGGRADGLAVGAQGRLVRHGAAVGEIELLHLAEHSAACQIKNPVQDAQVGDSAFFAIAPVGPPSPGDSSRPEGTATATPEAPTKVVSRPVPSTPPRVSGSLWTQGELWDDRSLNNLNSSQLRGSLDLRIDDLLAPNASFQLRTTGRHDRRDLGVNLDPYNDWSSQITELSFSYAPAGQPLAFSVGRILPAQLFISQRIDGVEFESRLSEHVRTGAFGGSNSRWQYDDLRAPLQTYGVFAGYRNAPSRALYIDFTLAAIGEFHGKTSSREALLTQGRIGHSSLWSLSQSAEIEVNTGWRRNDAGGSLFSVSSAYASGQYRFAPWFNASLTYDTRQNYRTYETREIVDSIFDDRVRQGVRGQVNLTFHGGFSASGGMGYRHRSGDPDATYSYTAAVRQSGLFTSRTSLSVDGSRFTGAGSDGQNLSVTLGQSLRVRDWISAGYGLYNYSLASDSRSRHTNQRWTVSSRFELRRSLYLSGTFEIDHGDDREGRRWELGLGRTF